MNFQHLSINLKTTIGGYIRYRTGPNVSKHELTTAMHHLELVLDSNIANTLLYINKKPFDVKQSSKRHPSITGKMYRVISD